MRHVVAACFDGMLIGDGEVGKAIAMDKCAHGPSIKNLEMARLLRQKKLILRASSYVLS